MAQLQNDLDQQRAGLGQDQDNYDEDDLESFRIDQSMLANQKQNQANQARISPIKSGTQTASRIGKPPLFQKSPDSRRATEVHHPAGEMSRVQSTQLMAGNSSGDDELEYLSMLNQKKLGQEDKAQLRQQKQDEELRRMQQDMIAKKTNKDQSPTGVGAYGLGKPQLFTGKQDRANEAERFLDQHRGNAKKLEGGKLEAVQQIAQPSHSDQNSVLSINTTKKPDETAGHQPGKPVQEMSAPIFDDRFRQELVAVNTGRGVQQPEVVAEQMRPNRPNIQDMKAPSIPESVIQNEQQSPQ